MKKATGIPVPSALATKVFTGGEQGFVSLKLDDIEIVNHNTKKLRFSFDDPESVSGLNIACEDQSSNLYL